MNAFLLETYNLPTQKLLGVKYTLARAPTQPTQSELFKGESGIAVYRISDVFNRAWAVHEIVPIRNADQGRALIQEHLSELRSKALSLNSPAPKLSPCSNAKDVAVVTRYAPERVTISADMSCDGTAVLSDTYYPGWYASVDGRPVPIYEVDLALRGVAVPKGSHTIVFRYRPRSVFLGAGLTLAGLLGAAALTFGSGKKARFVHAHSH